MTLSKTAKLCGLVFYHGPLSARDVSYQVEIQNQVFCKEVKDFLDGKNIYIDVVPNVLIKAHIPITIKFTIKGSSTYYEQTVDEATKEITYRRKETIISKFNVSSDVANGLHQIPTLFFSTDNTTEIDSDSSESD